MSSNETWNVEQEWAAKGVVDVMRNSISLRQFDFTLSVWHHLIFQFSRNRAVVVVVGKLSLTSDDLSSLHILALSEVNKLSNFVLCQVERGRRRRAKSTLDLTLMCVSRAKEEEAFGSSWWRKQTNTWTLYRKTTIWTQQWKSLVLLDVCDPLLSQIYQNKLIFSFSSSRACFVTNS